jgi:hypothetical protein
MHQRYDFSHGGYSIFWPGRGLGRKPPDDPSFRRQDVIRLFGARMSSVFSAQGYQETGFRKRRNDGAIAIEELRGVTVT